MIYKILLLPGDGIGVEVMAQAVKVLDAISKKFGVKFDFSEDLIGGCSIDKHNTPLTKSTLKKALQADAVLMGSVGGPKWDNLPVRPEVGLLEIRKEMNVYANLRPIIVFDELVNASSLKPEYVKGLDMLIVRELTGGLYFGQPKYREKLNENEEKACDAMTYTSTEISRIAKVAFDLASKRRKSVCSVDKANVLTVGKLWRDVVTNLSQKYPDIALSHLYVDNAAMQIVRNPKQFDVMVTENMFGDILSDCAAQLTGSIGMLPSASVNFEGEKKLALYEPVHGSAPDIAGQDKANPIAMIACLSMMFRYSFDRNDLAEIIDNAVKNALKNGFRTGDIFSEGTKLVGTQEMGDKIAEYINK